MKAIKFRGVDLKTGKFIYGDFVHYVPQSSFNGIVDEDGFLHEIEYNSLAQFLYRYPPSNEEYYSGDQVGFSPDGRPLSIQNAIVLVDNCGKSFFFDERFFQHANDVFPPCAIEYTDLLKCGEIKSEHD